jgi:hypothetical protein
VANTILQSDLAVNFVYPFLIVFFIVFAILEKTHVLGEDKKQINALVAFIIGLIFVSAVQPKLIVNDLILYLSIALILMFVILLLWGFASGGDLKTGDILVKPWLKWVVGLVIVAGAFVVMANSAGINFGFLDKLFNSSWSENFWTNVLFIVLIAVALAVVLKAKVAKSD